MDPQQVLFAVISAALVIVISFPIHEFSHAFAAYRLGDSTARWQGRLTLDPRAHFDLIGAAALMISSILGSGIGWAKPTPVNPYNLRYGRRGEALVAMSGPLSNLIMAAVLAIPIRLISTNAGLEGTLISSPIAAAIWNVAFGFFVINCALFVFNLVPIFPLDGWKVLLGLVDARTSYTLRQYEQYGMLLLFVLIVVGAPILVPLIRAVVAFLAPEAGFYRL